MRTLLHSAVLVVTLVAGRPAAAAINQTLWLDASDSSTLELAGNVVQAWRDKTPHHNDLLLDSGGPLAFGGGVELVERTSGIVDRLKGTAVLAAGNEAFLMFLVCRAYSEVGRVFMVDSNNMSVLRTGAVGDDLLSLQINNATACTNTYANAGIGQTQVYVMSRVPNGTGQDVTMERFGGGQLSASVACSHEPIQALRFDNGGTSFPTNPEHGMIIFEVRCFSATLPAPSMRGPQTATSPFDRSFIQSTMTELATRWNVETPTPVETTTWGQIKLMMK